MKTLDQKETDTLLILRCFNIAIRDPFTTCMVYSPDTDEFLLLIHLYPFLSKSLLFHTEKGKGARKVDIASSYEGIGPCHAQDALANLGEEQQLDEEDKLILDDKDDEPDSFEINLKK